jgi:hypothetical protein
MTDYFTVLYFPFFKIGARWIDESRAVRERIAAEEDYRQKENVLHTPWLLAG